MREAEQTMRELKGSSQRTAGASLRYIRTNSADPWAWSGQLTTASPGSPSTGNAFFDILLTSTNAPVFLNDLVLEMFKSTDSGATYSQVDPTAGNVVFFLKPAAPIGITPYQTKWLASVSGPINTYAAFQLQALTTDEVTITVTRRD
ncbi:hypothetical protein [Streptomyces turgidiscabies]|uniref:hypothetical protein n=1 Tax=Streptomyces turgidiscabies TaxID=85558 RepID=UPI0038F64A3E